MKRFLLFAFHGYEPCGGMGDYVGDFDTIELYVEELVSQPYYICTAHVLDTVDNMIIYYSRNDVWEKQGDLDLYGDKEEQNAN